MTIDGHKPWLSATVCSRSDTGADSAGAGVPPEYPPAATRKRFRLLQLFAAGLLALMLAFAPAAPAQATLSDCVNAAFPAQGFADAAKLAADVAGCTGQVASGDPVMAAAIATMTALAIAGVIPTNTNQCYAAIDQVIGKVLAEALAAAGIDGALAALGILKADLQSLMSGQVSLHQLANSVPGLQILLGYVNCGCKIVGAPDAAKQIAENYIASAEGCAGFVADALGDFVNWLTGGICDGLEDIGLGCRAAGGGDQTCYMSGSQNMKVQFQGATPSGKCDLDKQCNNCGWSWCGYIDTHAFGISPGLCACQPPFTSNYNTGKLLQSCTCDPPNMTVAGGACVCPANQQLKEGVCVPCTEFETYSPAQTTTDQGITYVSQPPKCISCPLGQRANAAHNGCINACDNAAGEIFDGKGKCVKCGENQIAVHQIGSLGSCQDCPSGQRGSADRSKCIPACAAGQVTVHGFTTPDTKTADSCFTCPKDTQAVHPDQNSSNGTCEPCPDGYTALPGSSACQELNCGVSGFRDPDNPHACKACPTTQIYIPAKKEIVTKPGGEKTAVVIPGHCGCGDIQRLEGDKCVCPANSIKITNPTIGGSVSACACPEGGHVDPATFACVCAAGATLDPTGTKCGCPTGQRIEGDKCVSPTLQKVPLRKDCSTLGPNFINNPNNAAACVRCPAGRIANAAGDACVRASSPPVQRIIPVVPRRPGPALQCPPRMMPNAAGTACIPRPNAPAIRAPGMLRPGVGERGPAGAPFAPPPR